MDCCLTSSSVHGIFQARILGRLPFPTLGDLPHPGTEPTSCVSYIGRWIIYHWATWETPSNDHSRYNFMTACSVSETLLGTLYQFSSVAQSCLTLCNMDCSMQGFLVLHQLPELAQTHIHRVGDAIQPSHPLSSPSPPVFNLSQHQGLFQGVSSSHQVVKVLEFWFQHQFFQWIFRTDFSLEWTALISLESKRLSRVFSNTTVQKHQFFGTQLSSQSNSHIHTWPLEKP